MHSVQAFFSAQFSGILAFFGINFLDIIILVILIFYAYEGYMLGVLIAGLDLLSFIFSFIVALKFYSVFGMFLADVFGISPGFARAIGFFILAMVSELIINIVLKKLAKKIPPLSLDSKLKEFLQKSDHILGVVPGLVSAFIILSFLLSVIISLPSSPYLKQLVTESRFGRHLVANAATFEKRLDDIFGGALNETMNFMTVKPSSNETIDLRFTVSSPSIDAGGEKLMLQLLNKERQANGLDPLVRDDSLRGLARDYAKDMFRRGYFSHYNPEKQSPFDRMDAYGIKYGYAGENLALAPSTELAMQGLMNSPGHRANILSPNFTKVGIGVMDGGIYGKMFTQEFTD
jgi:uncharacterized protein YkwD